MRRLTAIGACKAGKRAAIPAADIAVEGAASPAAAAAEVAVVGAAAADVVDERASVKGGETR